MTKQQIVIEIEKANAEHVLARAELSRASSKYKKTKSAIDKLYKLSFEADQDEMAKPTPAKSKS